MSCSHLLCPKTHCVKLSEPPKAKKARGQPRSPWRVRVEQERAAESVMAQVERAILAGHADKVLAQLTGLLAVSSFSAFCQAAWHVVEPSTTLDWGKHHELLCTTLQALFEDWLKTKSDPEYTPNVVNCAINCPPGSLKSKLIAQFFHAWAWLRCPGAKFIYLSVNESAAMRDARATRDLVRSDWYQETFKPSWAIKGDQDAISDFGNNAGGGRLSQASGSEIVGLRSDFLIVDDANNPNDSNNIGERKKVNDLWDTNQYNRVNDPNKSMRITIQQRTHAGDHTGHIIAKQGLWSLNNRTGWLHVVLPAEFEVKRPAFKLPVPLRRLVKDLPGIVMDDWRRKQGEVLHPKRMTAEYLEAEKRRWAGTGNYAGQMQQRPSSEGGGKVKKLHYGWFRLARGVRDDIDGEDNGFPRPEGCHLGEAVVIGSATHRPGKWDFDQIVISVDPALKKTEAGSLWGMLAIGYKGAGRYVLDDRSERGEPDEAVAILKQMILYWDPDKLLIEDKAGGPGMTRTLKVEMAEGKLPMVLIEEVNPGTQDKDVRLNTAIPTIANGNLYLRDGARWTHDVVEEVSGYPGAMTNDRLDCITQAINHANEANFVLPGEGSWAAAGL